MNSLQNQRGTVLVISLIMLVVMTLLAITSINMSTINLRIVGNMQSQMEVEAAVQNAIEGVISEPASFATPAAANANVAGYTVEIEQPQCILSAPSAGYEAGYGISGVTGVRLDNDWVIVARNTAGDERGEFAEITQGARVRAEIAPCP